MSHSSAQTHAAACPGLLRAALSLLLVGLTGCASLAPEAADAPGQPRPQLHTLYIDGSFVTDKIAPNDYDACWDPNGVKHDLLDPVLLRADDAGKQLMAEKYGGDIRIAHMSFSGYAGVYLDFFQTGRDGRRKGIVALNLEEAVL